MTDEQRQLAQSLIVMPNGKRDLSPRDFAREFPAALDGGKLAARLLTDAAGTESADDLQAAMIIGATFGFSSTHVPILCALLEARWHFCHEDIVSTLQHLKDPRAIDALFSAATVYHDYLSYDEFFGLARKCTWALADIGTPEARARLEALAAHEVPQIAEYAKERIDNWEDELDRKNA